MFLKYISKLIKAISDLHFNLGVPFILLASLSNSNVVVVVIVNAVGVAHYALYGISAIKLYTVKSH
jgi:hypothetical protein